MLPTLAAGCSRLNQRCDYTAWHGAIYTHAAPSEEHAWLKRKLSGVWLQIHHHLPMASNIRCAFLAERYSIPTCLHQQARTKRSTDARVLEVHVPEMLKATRARHRAPAAVLATCTARFASGGGLGCTENSARHTLHLCARSVTSRSRSCYIRVQGAGRCPYVLSGSVSWQAFLLSVSFGTSEEHRADAQSLPSAHDGQAARFQKIGSEGAPSRLPAYGRYAKLSCHLRRQPRCTCA